MYNHNHTLLSYFQPVRPPEATMSIPQVKRPPTPLSALLFWSCHRGAIGPLTPYDNMSPGF